MGVTVEVALAGEMEVEPLGPQEALEESDGLARVAVSLGNGCSHAYVIAGTANDLRVAVARIARAVEASETMSVRGSSVGE